MEFWNKLSTALRQKGFSAAQIKKLREAFGALDAAGLLRTPPDQLLPAVTGRTVAEKREKIETLLATVREVQSAAAGRPSFARAALRIQDAALLTSLRQWRPVLEKEGIQSSLELRRLAQKPTMLRDLGLDTQATNTLAAFTALSRVFPAEIALALQEANATKIAALKGWSTEQFEDALKRAGISREKITAERDRFERLQKLVEHGTKPETIDGIMLDIGPDKALSRADRAALSKAGVETLGDWAALRHKAKVSKGARAQLDARTRLYQVGVAGDLASKLVQADIASAHDLARLSTSQVAALSHQLKEPGVRIYAAVQHAQQNMRIIQGLLRATQTAGNGQLPAWIANNQIIGVIGTINVCIECPDAASIFSCFAYIVDLIQLTGKTLDELNDELGINLRDLSATSVLEPVSDPDPGCEEITVCDRVVRLLQDYLDRLRVTAGSRTERDLYTYAAYETWRANRMAYYYPELNALWRDDVLTGEVGPWDRGSFIFDSATNRQLLEDELAEVTEVVETARVYRHSSSNPAITPNIWKSAPLFKTTHPVYYVDFKQGLAVISDVLAADRTVHEGLQFLDQDETGLALDRLHQAAADLDAMANNVFVPGSSWILLHESGQLPYDGLLNTPPGKRQQHLNTLFEALASGNKKIFTPRNLDVQITGLSETGEVDLSPGWKIQGQFKENRGRIVSETGESPSLVRYQGNNDFGAFTNYALTTDFVLWEALLDGEQLGIGARLATTWDSMPMKGYRLVIKQRTTGGGNFRTLQTLVLEKLVEGNQGEREHRELESKEIGSLSTGDGSVSTIDEDWYLLQTGKTYTLFLSVVGGTITGRLRISQDRSIDLSAIDSAYNAGTFGFYASEKTLVEYSNVRFEIEGGGGGYPPFHADRRVNDRHSLDDGAFLAHRDRGTGMALDDLSSQSLTFTTARRTAVQLHGLKEAGPDNRIFLLFDEGTPAILTDHLDDLLEKCLMAAFYLRYAVIPTRLAQAYLLRGEYERAASYLHLLYDDSVPGQSEAARTMYPFLTAAPEAFTTTVGADARLVRLRLAEIYLAWAEWLFRQNTTQSRYQARQLYTRVLSLFGEAGNCGCESRLGLLVEQLLDRIKIPVSVDMPNPDDWEVSEEFINIVKDMFGYPPKPIDYDTIIQAHLPEPGTVDPSDPHFAPEATANALKEIRIGISEAETKYQQAVGQVVRFDNLLRQGQHIIYEAELRAAARFSPDPVKVAMQEHQSSRTHYLPEARRPSPTLARLNIAARYLNYTGAHHHSLDREYYSISHTFCIPPNPLQTQQKKQACLMLDVLNACRNILGFTDEFVPPLRFEALLRLASSFADSAHATERDLLTFRQALETESYSFIQVTNSLAMSQADVGLEDMNVNLAQGDIRLADLQAAQVRDARDHFEGLLGSGLITMERLALGAAWASTAFSGLAAAGGILSAASTAIGIGTSASGNPAGFAVAGLGIAGTVLGGAQGLASFSSALSGAASMQASFERRRQEWEFNLSQNTFGLAIAQQNVTQAVARYGIAQRRYQIAQLQRDLAAGAVRYLEHKFLNRAMLVWLQRTSRAQYRTRLNCAIAASFMAERALALELQDQSLHAIRFDYFDPRRDGLLGATQLQTDLMTLENIRLTYLQRRMQMSKTISLSQVMPAEFQAFKNTGQLLFSTLMNWFDRDFPGHYLRLIKNVNVTVVALIPPHDGVRAMLRNSGLSTVVVGPPYSAGFTPKTMRRNPESVALSAPFQATGLFVLDYKDDLLLPFEGSGVATDWIFELPRAANRFDYRTIADVLITIEYTALDSPTYRQQVIEALDGTISAERPFSFRHQFADAWYDLHHLDLVQDSQQPMTISFATQREDFPPNIADAKIEQLALYAVRKPGVTDELDVEQLHFAGQDPAGVAGDSAATVDGIISTRLGNANNWKEMIGKPPFGVWTLALKDKPEIRKLFEDELIEDILFVITYGGETPAWP